MSASRATWRLIKRSDSNLSTGSNKSCSTIKSTASQQLQKHLDEAYRRHRTCKSQQEREFIDSINVLRQASRHALQTSRSSSKSRQVKSSTNKNEISCSASSSSSTGNEEQLTCLVNEPGDEMQKGSRLQLITEHFPQFQSPESPKQTNENNNNDYNSYLINHHTKGRREFDLSSKESRVLDDSQLVAASDELRLADDYHCQTQPAHQLVPNDNNPQNGYCCPCLSSLLSVQPTPTSAQQQTIPSNNNNLCQLICCPNSSQSVPINQQLPSCCPPLQRLANISEPNRLPLLSANEQQQLSLVADLPDLYCPLWRSMVLNYWQQQQHPQASIVSGNLATNHIISPLFGLSLHDQQMAAVCSHSGQPNLLMTQQPPQALTRESQENLAKQVGLVENYSSTMQKHQVQHQQQQHNTTIDLKIEIAGDFNAKNSNKQRAKSIRSHSGRSIKVNEPTVAEVNSSTTSGDSLESSTSGNDEDDEDNDGPQEDPKRPDGGHQLTVNQDMGAGSTSCENEPQVSDDSLDGLQSAEEAKLTM